MYKKLAMDFESDIRKNFIRLSKKRLECSKQLGASELRIVNRNNYTKILRHLKNENM